jgi:catechol 2,3-dioxygenase-like lactoylglutathione lyase family enzyme
MSTPFQLERIDHVVLIVEGMDKAIAWYGDVLGAKAEGDLMHVGMRQLRVGESMIDLVDVADPRGAWAKPKVEGGRNLDHFAVAVGDIDETALRAHFKRHGVEVHEEGMRSGAKGRGYSWYIRDPWGTVIELKS